MIERKTKFGIIGLGLLGGSYAIALSQKGYDVTGVDIDENACAAALEKGWAKKAGSDPELLSGCDFVISALYPRTFVEWIRTNQQVLKPGCLLSDVTGVKRCIIEQLDAILRPDVEFIACHPMAGREYRGISYADPHRFKAANFIVVPTQKNTEQAVSAARQLGEILGFRRVTELDPDKHDEMIGYLSQLTHVIAVSLMNANDHSDLAAYTGDSFRDLTRIAFINEDLWPQLFVMNKDYLLAEIDAFVSEMQEFRSLIDKEDTESMRQKLIQSSQRQQAFKKTDENK
jgi:prephenate dehydrogenase